MASDNFNRADAATLGAPWVEFIAGFSVASNAATPTNSGPHQFAQYVGAAVTNNQFVQATVLSAFTTGIMVRLTNPGGVSIAGYSLRGGAGDGSMVVYKVGATFDPVLLLVGNFAASDVIRLEVEGNTLRAYKNGSFLDSAVDASYPTGGQPGIHGAFSASDVWDDWSGGDFVPSTGFLLVTN